MTLLAVKRLFLNWIKITLKEGITSSLRARLFESSISEFIFIANLAEKGLNSLL